MFIFFLVRTWVLRLFLYLTDNFLERVNGVNRASKLNNTFKRDSECQAPPVMCTLCLDVTEQTENKDHMQLQVLIFFLFISKEGVNNAFMNMQMRFVLRIFLYLLRPTDNGNNVTNLSRKLNSDEFVGRNVG